MKINVTANWQPFAASVVETPSGPLQTYYCSVTDRLTAVKRMTDLDQLHAALKVDGLQKSVETAIHRRIKALSK
jgi:hypothetical protein